MNTGRLEAFSDGVIAIIITIMVLELKAPHEPTVASLRELWPVFLAYLLSFIFVGIYWNNHHHLWHAATKVNGSVLWANLHVLFWMSLVPFATDWIGETHFAGVPVMLYGLLLLATGAAWAIMVRLLVRLHGADSTLARAVGDDRKGKLSVALYILGVGLTFISPWLGMAVYAAVAAIWFVPDRRIENRIAEE